MRGLADFSLSALWASKGRAAGNDAPLTHFAIEVPFEFVVGTYGLPAGTYRFEALPSPTSGVCLLAVRDHEGRMLKLAVNVGQVASHGHFRSKLIFDRREEQHFLTEVWLPEKRLSLRLYRSLQDLDTDEANPETEVILLVELDYHAKSFYVIEDSRSIA